MRDVNGREPPQRPGIPPPAPDRPVPEKPAPEKPGDETAPGSRQAGETTCPRCGGTGSLGQVRCPDCAGSGRITALVGDA